LEVIDGSTCRRLVSWVGSAAIVLEDSLRSPRDVAPQNVDDPHDVAVILLSPVRT
jgi:hypothetical protein